MSRWPAEILLVEDNPGDVRLTLEALRESEIPSRVTVKEDGLEALEHLCRLRANAESLPGLVLLDLNLPKMDGRELLARIKSEPDFRAIPVVVLTTSQAPSDIRCAYELDANCFVTKPMNFEDFADLIASLQRFWLGTQRPTEPSK